MTETLKETAAKSATTTKIVHLIEPNPKLPGKAYCGATVYSAWPSPDAVDCVVCAELSWQRRKRKFLRFWQ